jgi:hypothetical protein
MSDREKRKLERRVASGDEGAQAALDRILEREHPHLQLEIGTPEHWIGTPEHWEDVPGMRVEIRLTGMCPRCGKGVSCTATESLRAIEPMPVLSLLLQLHVEVLRRRLKQTKIPGPCMPKTIIIDSMVP